MRGKYLIIIAFLHSVVLPGQNLVPNCDFDLTLSCPFATGQLDKAKNWYTPGEGTSDLCHACAGGSIGMPYNQWGQEESYSGQGYGHIICYYPFQGNDYREYMQVKLACPLLAGETYRVSFFASLTDKSRFAIDGLGLLFTDLPIYQSGDNVIDPGSPGHVFNPPGQVITQKTGWTEIFGTYTAAGGEEYITIGSFVPEDELTIQTIPGPSSPYCSFYIDMVSVIPINPIRLLGNDTTLCFGESLIIQAPSLCSGTFTWDDGTSDAQRVLETPGTYFINVHIGCSDLYDELRFSWFPQPEVTIPADTILCHGSSFWLNPGNFTSYLWQDGSMGPDFEVSQAGIYWVEVTDDKGCLYRDTTVVNWLGPPEIDLGDDRVLCLGDSTELVAGDDNAYTTYLWQDQSVKPYLMVRKEGLYSVAASNPCGQSFDDIQISYQNCDPLLSVPNAFTPNNDGINDSFRAVGINIRNFNMKIFNRWGEMIFSSDDPAKGWDGTKDGRGCSDGVYVWTIYYESDALETQFQETVSGTVMLIR